MRNAGVNHLEHFSLLLGVLQLHVDRDVHDLQHGEWILAINFFDVHAVEVAVTQVRIFLFGRWPLCKSDAEDFVFQASSI